MPKLPADIQLRVYTLSRALEARSNAFDSLVSTLKRTCLLGDRAARTEMVARATELEWHLQQLIEQTRGLQATLGLDPTAAPKAEQAGAPVPAPQHGGEHHDGNELRGTIAAIGLPDLVSTLSSLGKTGTLALHSGSSMFVFEFQEGRIVHAVTNVQEKEMRLGTILLAHNCLTNVQLQQRLCDCKVNGELLGSNLVRTATVSESDLRTALDEQVRRIFERAFALEDARFRFLEGNLSELEQRTTLNTTELLLEAARQSDHRAREAQEGQKTPEEQKTQAGEETQAIQDTPEVPAAKQTPEAQAKPAAQATPEADKVPGGTGKRRTLDTLFDR